MPTKEELKEMALKYLENTYPILISNIEVAMEENAKQGKECLYKYSVNTEDEARGMERYFKAKGFSTESSWSNYNEETKEFEGWYVNIFWW